MDTKRYVTKPLLFLAAFILAAGKLFAAPANDNFANAQLVNVPSGGITVAGSNLDATRETDEPNNHGDGSSVWYRIDPVAAVSGIRVTSVGAGFPPEMAVYRGTIAAGLTALQLVDTGTQDDGGRNFAQVDFAIPAGSTDSFFLAVGSSFSSGAVLLTVTTFIPPTNDAFANAQLVAVPSGGVTVAGNSLGATREPNEPSDHGDKSIWYRIDPSAAGQGIRITCTESGFSPRIAVYRESFAAGLSALQSVDTGGFSSAPAVDFVIPSGSTDAYFLAVGSSFDSGAVNLNFTTFTPSTNDDFANAQLVSVPSGGVTVPGSNLGTTRETNEPDSHGDSKSVWYRIDASAVGKGIRITTAGSGYSPFLAVYRGSIAAGLPALQLVDGGRNVFDSAGEQVDFVIPAGSTETFFLAAGCSSLGVGGAFQLNFTTFTIPANDAFASAQLVTVPSGGFTIASSNLGATRQTGEPTGHGSKKGRDIFESSGSYEQVDFVVPTGSTETYFLAVGGSSFGNNSGALQLNFSTFTLPANDAFASAQLVTVPTGGVTIASSNLGATRQTGEPAGHGDARSIWYRITPPTAGNGIRVNSAGSAFTPNMAVYRGSIASGFSTLQTVEEGTNASDSTGSYRQVDFVIPAGSTETYFLAVGSTSFGSSGALQLNFSTFAIPANDAFTSAQLVGLSSAGVTVPASNLGATRQPGEPTGHGSGKSVWFRIISPAAGTRIRVEADGDSFFPNLAVYRGTLAGGFAGLQVVDQFSNPSEFVVPSTSGGDYLVAVGSDTFEAAGFFNFTARIVIPPVPPANDNLSNAQVLNVAPFGNTTVLGSNVGATTEASEDSSGSVWYRINSPLPGTRFFVDAAGSTEVKVYTGNPAAGFSALTLVPGPYDCGSGFDIPDGPPQDYFIRAAGFSQGTIQLDIEAVPNPALMITGVIDGALSGGLPKAVELYALRDIPDLGLYAIGVADNGGGTDGPEFQLSGTLKKGEFLHVSAESIGFTSFFGFPPDLVASALTFNGDDAIELFYNPDVAIAGDEIVIDSLGIPAEDGTGEAWEYTDSWAYRIEGSAPNLGTFSLSDWDFLGPGGLIGRATNTAAGGSSFPTARFVSRDLVFPAVSAQPFERFDGDDDPFDLDHKTITFVPVNAAETDPGKWAYRYTVSDAPVPWLDLPGLDPNARFEIGGFDHPVSFPFYGELRSLLTIENPASDIEPSQTRQVSHMREASVGKIKLPEFVQEV